MPLLMALNAGNLTNSLWLSMTLVLLGLLKSMVFVNRCKRTDCISLLVHWAQSTFNKINININPSISHL